MKTIFDELKEMQLALNKVLEEISSLDEKIESLTAHRDELQAQADSLQEKISVSVKWSAYYEEKAREKLMYDTEALSTLYASTRTDGDFYTFCEQTGIELPPEISGRVDP